MATPNIDTLMGGIQLELGSGQHSNFLVDALPGNNFLGAVEAVAADTAASFYNLGALTGAYDPVSEDKLVQNMADIGLQDGAKYYKDHPQATQVIGMLAGGWKAGSMAAEGAVKLFGKLQKGEVLATDSGKTISKTMAKKEAMHAAAKEAGTASERFKAALKDYRRASAIDAAVGGAANVLASDLIMHESFALQDTTPTDLALGMALGGAAGYGLTHIARAISDTKAATQGVAEMEAEVVGQLSPNVPLDLKGTLGEGAVLSGQKQQNAEYVATLDNPRMKDWAAKVDRKIEARQLELIDQATHKDLRPEQGARVPGKYDFKADLQAKVKENLANAPVLAGAKRIVPFSPESHMADFPNGNVLEDVAFRFGVQDIPRVVKHVMDASARGWTEKDAGRIAKLTNESAAGIDNIQRVINTSLIDARTGAIHGLDEAHSIATSLDAGIKKVVEVDNASTHVGAGQVQFNNFDAIETGFKSMKGSVSLGTSTPEEVFATETFSEVLKHYSAAVNGKWGSIGKATAKDMIEYTHKRLKSEIIRMRKAGMSDMEISLRTHTDYEKVADTFKKGFRDKDLGKLLLPMDKEAITPYNAVAAVYGNAIQGQNAIQRMAAIDDASVRHLNKEIIAQFTAESESTLLGKLADLHGSGLGEGIRAGLRKLNPAMYTDNVFTSADMALRHQGDIVEKAIGFASFVKQATQEGISALTKQGNSMLQQIAQDPVHLIAWNKSEAAIRSTKVQAGQVLTVQGNELVVIDKKLGEVHPVLGADGQPLGALPENVAAYWQHFEETVSKETRGLINFHRGVNGIPEAVDKGIHLPPKNLANAHVAYAIDPATQETALITADSWKALESLMAEAKGKYPGRDIIHEKNDLARYNLIHDHVAVGIRQVADFNKAKTSAQYESISATTSQMSSFMQANNHHLMRLSKQAVRQMDSETIGHLRQMHELQGGSTHLFKDLEDTIYGGNILGRHEFLTKANDAFTGGLNWAIGVIDSVAGGAYDTVKGKLAKKFNLKSNAHDPQVAAKAVMEEFKARGLEDQLPWHSLNQAISETEAYRGLNNKAKDVVATNNFLTAALALRFADLSHPLVTTLSIAITTLPEAMMKAGSFSAMKHMMEGVRRAYSPAFKEHMGLLEERGIISSQVSEANDFIASSLAEPKLTSAIEQNKVFTYLSKPSDWAEVNARRVAAGVAASLYDAQHGGGKWLSEEGLAFVDLFTKRTMGNYNTHMRPAMFQGTGGAAIGLFQTYVWTMGQLLYRGLEQGNKGAVAAAMGVQAGVFGLRSLPGYDVVNHYIGAHYGNESNADITSSIYENVDSGSEAETILYGAPSTLLHTALWTRGVLNPRSPITVTEDGALNIAPAAAAPILNLFGMVKNTFDRATAGNGVGDSMLAAVQLQTLSRPFARAADMVAGESIDRKFSPVDVNTHPNEASGWATFARFMSSRPMQEQIDRDLSYQTSFYNRANSHARQELIRTLRMAANNGEPLPLASALTDYVARGGSRSGFRAALNKVYLESEEGKIATLEDSRLKMAIEMVGR